MHLPTLTPRRWIATVAALFALALLASNQLVTESWAQVVLSALTGAAISRAATPKTDP